MPVESALRLRDLSARFGGMLALDNVTLDIGAHELVCVIGANGAGKSTLLNAICRLVRTSGRVELFRRDISPAGPTAAARHGLGRSFQDPQLIDGATVLENLLCGAHAAMGYTTLDQVFRPARMRRREVAMAERAGSLLDRVGLAGAASRPVGELAYGPRKLIDILRALMPAPALLLLDEPSSGLDGVERAVLRDFLLDIQRRDAIPMLVVEHHMDLVRAISQRIVVLQAGGVVADGAAEEVLAQHVGVPTGPAPC